MTGCERFAARFLWRVTDSTPFACVSRPLATYTLPAYTCFVVIVESPWFTDFVVDAMDDEDYRELQNALIEDPALGDLIPGARGLRKLRWSLPGRGKRGGMRAIYYHYASADRLYLLYGYAKARREDLTRDQLKRLAAAMRQEMDDG